MATTTAKKNSTAKTSAKSDKLKYSKAQYLKWYEDMLLMRKLEEKIGALYIQQKFGGFCHLYIGQEALVTGTASGSKKGDKHITAYRDHAHPIALGVHPKYMVAELYGKTTGMSKGKGGSMHMFNKEVNLLGGHGIVGAQIPMGAGIAFAEKYNKTKNVCFCSFGDGAARQGSLHETFNMAMLWKLPVIFIVENNNYAMGTSVERTSNVEDLSQLGASYQMPGYTVDGMDVEKVHDAIEDACKHVRSGKGPVLLNIETYRYKGHSMSDPQKYRTKKEVEDYKSQDPIQKVLTTIKDNKLATDKQLEEIMQRVKDVIEESVKFAEESPEPVGSDLYEDVYKEPDYPYIKEY
ncbi:MAG: pyruvate dehydrogenase E1 component alpha subunit [Flavobacteriales bacterium]|jgi:pyruvate dehydrogenase E1 component alpha subunit